MHGTPTAPALASAITRQPDALAASKGRLLLAAFLAGKRHANLALIRRNAIGRAALSAFGVDPGLTLLHDDVLSLERLSYETLRLIAHFLF
jgi:hypothetical protein